MSAPHALAELDSAPVTSEIVVDDAALRADDLMARYGHLDGVELLRALFAEMPGQIALVSSFGAESAVLLAMAAEVDPAVPVAVGPRPVLALEGARLRYAPEGPWVLTAVDGGESGFAGHPGIKETSLGDTRKKDPESVPPT